MRVFLNSKQNEVARVLIILFVAQVANGCVDDDAGMAQLAMDNNVEDISACVDVLAGCNRQDNVGAMIRELCCETCADSDPDAPMIESVLPPTDETLQVFLLSGQSECTGSASVADLDGDAQYSDLHGIIDGVWFGGYQQPESADRFFIAPLDAGQARQKFGPEISFGDRYHAVTGKRTMMVKYCVGGTNVHTHWNPDTDENSWDKEADDGTAQWMVDNAGLNFTSKDYLFKNMVYTIRKANETLTDAGIPFEWTGIIWVQGNGDKDTDDPIWKTFGEDTARVWDGFRDALGGGDNVIPIIDNGAANNNDLKSGKEYATQIVNGCKAKNLQWASGYNAGGCVPTTTNPCLDSNSSDFNPAFYDFYGYDTAFPEESKPENATNKTFHWFVSYGEKMNLHSAYEGMILAGRALASNFILEFTDHNLPSEYADVDPAVQFPLPRCDDGTSPSLDNFCWIDHRDEAMMVELCEEEETTPTLAPSSYAGTTDDPDEGIGAAFFMLISLVASLFAC